MEAKLTQKGEISIVTISGHIELEKSQQFQNVCAQNFLDKKVVFDIQNVQFVGSTGLKNFIDVVKTIGNDNSHGIKIVGAKSEFRRIFANMDCQKLEIHETQETAIRSFLLPNIDII